MITGDTTEYAKITVHSKYNLNYDSCQFIFQHLMCYLEVEVSGFLFKECPYIVIHISDKKHQSEVQEKDNHQKGTWENLDYT